jgi:DNA-binding CsgD family transcriptional regulator
MDDPRLLTWAGIAAVNLGDIGIVQALFRRAVESARNSGSVASLPYPLEKWAVSEALAGNFASARMSADEGLRLAQETEQLGSACHLRATLALVAGTCGDEDECRRRGQESLDEAVPRGLGLPIANVAWAFGRLDLGLGRHESAVDHLLSMHGTAPGRGNAVIALWATPDLVEAAVRAGRQAEVTDAVARLDAWAVASGQPTAAASVARCRGLLDDPDAVDLLTEAAESFRAAHSSYEEARTELVLGELLRRRRLRGDARKQLRAAFGTFERLGARPWADRAAAELRAAGEQVQRDGIDGVHQLTSQELQIIRHVCDGASNRDVAAQLFISPRTVEYHLYKAYPKLGVSSRTQLLSRFGAGTLVAGLS